MVPRDPKCTNIVPFVELEFAQFDALEAEIGRPSRGMESAAFHASGRLERPFPIALTQEI